MFINLIDIATDYTEQITGTQPVYLLWAGRRPVGNSEILCAFQDRAAAENALQEIVKKANSQLSRINDCGVVKQNRYEKLRGIQPRSFPEIPPLRIEKGGVTHYFDRLWIEEIKMVIPGVKVFYYNEPSELPPEVQKMLEAPAPQTLKDKIKIFTQETEQ